MLFDRHPSTKTYQLFIIGWMLLAALFPLYAPWLNSNFAALQPGHNHLYIGKVDPDHHHGSSLDELVSHHHATGNGESEVTNLPNLDAASGTAVLVILSHLLIPFAASLTLFFLFRERSLGVNLLNTTPPIPPPRFTFS